MAKREPVHKLVAKEFHDATFGKKGGGYLTHERVFSESGEDLRGNGFRVSFSGIKPRSLRADFVLDGRAIGTSKGGPEKMDLRQNQDVPVSELERMLELHKQAWAALERVKQKEGRRS